MLVSFSPRRQGKATPAVAVVSTAVAERAALAGRSIREGLGERPNLRDFGVIAEVGCVSGVDIGGCVTGGNVVRGVLVIGGSAREANGCDVSVVRADGVEVGKRRYRARLEYIIRGSLIQLLMQNDFFQRTPLPSKSSWLDRPQAIDRMLAL